MLIATRRNLWKSAIVAGAVLTCSAAELAAQQQPPPPQGQQRQVQPPTQQRQGAAQPGQPAATQQQQSVRVIANRPVDGRALTPDQQIAECVAISNQEEIALGQIASQRAADKQVKEFADMLVKDHSKQLETLRKFGGGNIQLNANASDRRPAMNQQPTAAAGGANQGQHFDPLDVKRQVAELCVQGAQKEWSEKKAEECDMFFVGAQLVAHKQMINDLKVLRNYASPTLQAELDKSLETTQAHLKHAEKLIDTLSKKEHGQSSQQR